MPPPEESPAWDPWADYYDLMDGDRRAMVDFYRGLVQPGTRSMLELACGTGRVAGAIAQAHSSLRVVGVDHSPGMIALARARHPDCGWILGDIRRLPVRENFDLAICCYNTVQQMLRDDDLIDVFIAVRSILSPAGRFAFDLYQPNEDYLRVNQTNRLVRERRDDRGHLLQIREDTKYDPASRIYDLAWRLVDVDEKAVLTSMAYRYRQFMPYEIESALDAAGLRPVKRFGGFDGAPLDAVSIKQIYVTRPS
jgi:SAM-dependent methyltransferase